MAADTTGSDAIATLWYLKDIPLYATTKPYIVNLPPALVPRGKRTNQVSVPVSGIPVKDMRCRKEAPKLDTNGFQFTTEIESSMSYEDWEDPAKVADVYVKEVEAYLKGSLGVEKAIVLSPNIRRRHESFPAQPRGSKETRADQPIQGVHSDFTPSRAHDIVRQTFGEETATKLFRENRIQFIHVWRPLRGPVLDWPLAVCDYRSVDVDHDLVATDNVYPHVVSETFSLLHNPQHAWYYLSKQMPHESLLFKGFDSADVAKFCPHAAFELLETRDTSQFRESVECTFLLVHPSGTGQWRTPMDSDQASDSDKSF